jgi:hypothetical protein
MCVVITIAELLCMWMSFIYFYLMHRMELWKYVKYLK